MVLIKDFLHKMKYYIFLVISKYRFNKKNRHNFCQLKSCNLNFDITKLKIGNYTYGELNILSFGKYDQNLIIGNFCSIAENVYFLIGGEHRYDCFSTYPYHNKFLHDDNNAISKGDIILEDDVWIGYGCTILSGVRIGKGAVIAAKSVIVKDIPPYAIVGGNPAKVIKYRFTDDIISKLKNIDYSNIFDKDIKYMKDIIDLKITDNNIIHIIESINEKGKNKN